MSILRSIQLPPQACSQLEHPVGMLKLYPVHWPQAVHASLLNHRFSKPLVTPMDEPADGPFALEDEQMGQAHH